MFQKDELNDVLKTLIQIAVAPATVDDRMKDRIVRLAFMMQREFEVALVSFWAWDDDLGDYAECNYDNYLIEATTGGRVKWKIVSEMNNVRRD